MKIPRRFFPQWVVFLAGLWMVLWLGGCTSSPSTRNEPYQTRVFIGNYDQVWLAALKALNDYPLKVSNKDIGKIQSEVINGPYNELLFAHPEPIDLPERFRYSLKLNFAKLVGEDDEPLIRVRVIKDLERFQDFYAGWLPYPPDGLEERLLLYRIEHLLRMDELLEDKTSKATEKPKKKSAGDEEDNE